MKLHENYLLIFQIYARICLQKYVASMDTAGTYGKVSPTTDAWKYI